MKAWLLCCVGAAAAVAPPRIELALDATTIGGTVTAYGAGGGARLEKLQESQAGDHSLGYTQPNGARVGSRQDWTLRCAVPSDSTLCPLPEATAFDHTDGTLPVTMTMHRVDLDGAFQNGTSLISDNVLDYTQRATYLIFFDAQDSAGNHAEQVVFSIILDDLLAPVIDTDGTDGAGCSTGKVFVEASTAQAAALCWADVATDNVDNDVSASIRYQVTNALDTSAALWCDAGQTRDARSGWCTAAEMPSVIDGETVGDFRITVRANDGAGKYGHNFEDNIATATRTVVVRDTTRPVTVVAVAGSTGWTTAASGGAATDTRHECARPYTDPGATSTDSHHDVPVQWDDHATTVQPSTTGTYTVTYQAHDNAVNPETGANAFNFALNQTRLVSVEDNTPPTITAIGGSLVEHHATRTNQFSDTLTDPGVNCTDLCDTSCATNDCAITTEWLTTLNETQVGDYVRRYKCFDASNQWSSVDRTFRIVDSDAPLISITGDNPLTVQASTTGTFTDPGATCEDYHEGPLTPVASAQPSDDPVNLAVTGTYTVRYTCTDSATPTPNSGYLERTVVVKDLVPPTLALDGGASTGHIYREAGFPYSDDGATASDVFDGVISGSVTTTYNATIAAHAQPGTYLIEYNVQDAANNSAVPIYRTVTVEDTLPPVISLRYASTVIAAGTTGQVGHNSEVNPVAGSVVLMAERPGRGGGAAWAVAGAAASVAGLALLGLSQRRRQLTVPV